jgi:hypothetical protein
VKHFHDDPDPPPFIKALAEVRQLAAREGWCYQHFQAIAVAVDQCAAKAYGNRRLHGSVRLFHAQLLTKPAPTYLVSHETNEFCTTPFFEVNGKVLKRDWSIITAFNEHKGMQ